MRSISEVAIASLGIILHLEGDGFTKVFKIIATHNKIEYWATHHLKMADLECGQYASYAWTMGNYHCGIKQITKLKDPCLALLVLNAITLI